MNVEAPVSPYELRAPTNPELAGLPIAMLEDIVLRTAIAIGRPSIVQLAERLHCAVGVIDGVVNSMRDRRLV